MHTFNHLLFQSGHTDVCFCFGFLQRLTDTCWSSEVGPSLCQPSAPIKEVAAVEEVEKDATAAS